MDRDRHVLAIWLSGYLASTVLHNFSLTVAGLSFHSIDTIFTGTGLLVVLGGIFAFINLRALSMDTEIREAKAELEEVVEK